MHPVVSHPTAPSSLLRLRRAGVAFALVAATAAFGVGCATSSSEPAPSGESTAPATAPAAPEQQTDAARGPGAMLKRSLATLSTRPEQKVALDRVRSEIDAATAQVSQAKQRLAAELASEVRAGSVDHQKLAPLEQALDAAAAATKPAMQNVMNELHATLDAAQRKQLVSSMREEFHGRHGFRDHKEHMREIAKEIGLSDAQMQSIHAKLKEAMPAEREGRHGDHEAMRSKMRGFAEAFEGDTFDAKSFDFGGEAFASHHVDKIERIVAAALPELTPAQRSALADKILAHARAE